MARSILIIDDDALLRNALKEIFEHLTYDVFMACNGEDGVASYRRIATDIVITDICMPVKDGLETIREIKKEFPEAKIIAMSGIGCSNTGSFRVARYLGATSCIRKPFEPDDIIRIVNLTLNGNEAESGMVGSERY